MLVQLSIKDIVLIDRLDMTLDAGLTVLTGETGAGKSILLDAFALALGGRGDGSLVREGVGQGQVSAAFDVPKGHPARRAAEAADIDIDGDLILRRVQMLDGRTRAFLNDQPVSVQALKSVGAALVEIHGQHDERALLDPSTHRAVLDAAGGLGTDEAKVSELYATMRAREAALLDLEVAIAKARSDGDFLKHSADELGKLGVEIGEEERLAERRLIMQQSEKVASELRDAAEIFNGERSAVPAIAAAARRLERRSQQAPSLIEPSLKALDAALLALDDVQSALETALREAEFEPRELELCEERLFALRAAARKYQVVVDDLPREAARFRAELAAIDAGENRLQVLQGDVAAARAAYGVAALQLSELRKAAAKALDAAVTAALAPLKLERARFISVVEADARRQSASGIDHVEFFVQTNPGTKAGPMMKVASGGELSRFMLALKVVLADRGSAPTLVFDEIDSGAGGAVADAIGQRLRRLAAEVQVLCVTHAPQVAAQADRHFLIEKTVAADGMRVATGVGRLETKARREEIARMLSGETISAEARAAAERLLVGSR
jgi:DNA repair protein RecN (Recombination protein N)